MASGRMCLLTVLCSIVILTVFISSTQSASCCMKYTTRRFRCQRLQGYTIQPITASCDILAVIFHLPGSRLICANPSLLWTQQGMRCIDERKRNGNK